MSSIEEQLSERLARLRLNSAGQAEIVPMDGAEPANPDVPGANDGQLYDPVGPVCVPDGSPAYCVHSPGRCASPLGPGQPAEPNGVQGVVPGNSRGDEPGSRAPGEADRAAGHNAVPRIRGAANNPVEGVVDRPANCVGRFLFPRGEIRHRCSTEGVPIRPFRAGDLVLVPPHVFGDRVVPIAIRQERARDQRPWSQRGPFCWTYHEIVVYDNHPPLDGIGVGEWYGVYAGNRRCHASLRQCPHHPGAARMEYRYARVYLNFRPAAARPQAVEPEALVEIPDGAGELPENPIADLLQARVGPPPVYAVQDPVGLPAGLNGQIPEAALLPAYQPNFGMPLVDEALPAMRIHQILMAQPAYAGGNEPWRRRGPLSSGPPSDDSDNDSNISSRPGSVHGARQGRGAADNPALPPAVIDPAFVAVFDNNFVRDIYLRIRLTLLALNPRARARVQVTLIDLYHLLRRITFRQVRDAALEMRLKLEAERYVRSHSFRGYGEEFITDAVAMCIVAAMADTSNDDIAEEIYSVRARQMARVRPIGELTIASLRSWLGYPETRPPGFHQGLVERFARATEDCRPLDATVLLARLLVTSFAKGALISALLYNWRPLWKYLVWKPLHLLFTVGACATNGCRYITDTWLKHPIQIQVTCGTAPTSLGGP